MPSIGIAIASVEQRIVRHRDSLVGLRVVSLKISRAVRPGPIGIDAHTAARLALDIQRHPGITLGSRWIPLIHVSDVLSLNGIQQAQNTARVGIGGRVAIDGGSRATRGHDRLNASRNEWTTLALTR